MPLGNSFKLPGMVAYQAGAQHNDKLQLTKPAQAFPGLLAPGNIDLQNRPVVKNPDGTQSTVKTITIESDGKTILLPTIIDGKAVSNAEAIAHWKKTGQHMGVFQDEKAANEYDKHLHVQMGWEGPKGSAQEQWMHPDKQIKK